MGREVNKMILHGKCYENDRTSAKWRPELLRHTWAAGRAAWRGRHLDLDPNDQKKLPMWTQEGKCFRQLEQHLPRDLQTRSAVG